MEDVIRIADQYYILAASSRTDERTRVLKHGESFAVFDLYGDVVPFGLGEQGLFHAGTRHLSCLELRVDGVRPLLLSSTVKDSNDLLTVDLTNPDLERDGRLLRRGMLHFFRARILCNGACYERLRITNFGLEGARVTLSLLVEADFADVFEVRGSRRARRGEALPPEARPDGVVLAYSGLDGVLRRTAVESEPGPARVEGTTLHHELELPPHDAVTLDLTVRCEPGAPDPRRRFDEAQRETALALEAARARGAALYSSNAQFNDWVNRSLADLHMMMTDLPGGPYPYAGVPWFCTAFGRDGIITALEMLWVDPVPARGVLAFLASTQADASDPARDAEPGKILHETRQGEMAALGEIPFGRYYGSIDATPLFVILAAAYHERTADIALVSSLWDSIERALAWIDRYGDADGDGFVEYQRRSATGLVHQGWKDSADAVFHSDGAPAAAPIALCEVQAYVYAAWLGAARMATALKRRERAEELERKARALRERFERTYWLDDLDAYALALDGAKRPCRVVTSNAGHCLFAGIADPARARRLASRLMREDCFSGFGIRTVASGERRYNPMSYHNGSVWPHDNALIAAGFARYGMNDLAARLLTGFLDASLFVDLHRMPELFCGFTRRAGEGPTAYPVACAPQSWSAATVLLLLQACLGLEVDAQARRLVLRHACLPGFLDTLEIRNLRVAEDEIDLLVERHAHNVGIQVLRRSGPVEIVSVK